MTKFRKLGVLVDKLSILGIVRVELMHRNGAVGCRIFHTGLQMFLFIEKSNGTKASRVFPKTSCWYFTSCNRDMISVHVWGNVENSVKNIHIEPVKADPLLTATDNTITRSHARLWRHDISAVWRILLIAADFEKYEVLLMWLSITGPANVRPARKIQICVA